MVAGIKQSWEKIASDDRYKSAPPDKQQFIREDWFERKIKSHPKYKPELDERIKKDLFGDIPSFNQKSEQEKEEDSRVTEELADAGIKAPVRSMQGIMGGFSNMVEWLGDSIKESPDALFNSQFQFAGDEQKQSLKKLREDGNLEYVAEKQLRAVGEKMADLGDYAGKYWEKARKEGQFSQDPKLYRGTFMEDPTFIRAVGIGVEAVPYLGLAATTSIATGNPFAGAAVLGFMEGANTYNEAKDAGKSFEEASRYGLMVSAISTITEQYVLDGILKGGSGKIVKDVLETAGKEGGEEVIQNTFQNLVAKYGYDETRNITEGLVESFIGGALSGGVIGGFSSGRIKQVEKIMEDAQIGEDERATIYQQIASKMQKHGKEIDEVLTKTHKDIIEKAESKNEGVEQDQTEKTDTGSVTMETAEPFDSNEVLDKSVLDLHKTINGHYAEFWANDQQVILDRKADLEDRLQRVKDKETKKEIQAEIKDADRALEVAENQVIDQVAQYHDAITDKLKQSIVDKGYIIPEGLQEELSDYAIEEANDPSNSNVKIGDIVNGVIERNREALERNHKPTEEEQEVAEEAPTEEPPPSESDVVRAPSERWIPDENAAPGEPFLRLMYKEGDRDPQFARASIRETKNESGEKVFEILNDKGEVLGLGFTLEKAVDTAELLYPDFEDGKVDEDIARQVIELAGGFFRGIIKGEGEADDLILFDADGEGSTMSIEPIAFDIDMVRHKIENYNADKQANMFREELPLEQGKPDEYREMIELFEQGDIEGLFDKYGFAVLGAGNNPYYSKAFERGTGFKLPWEAKTKKQKTNLKKEMEEYLASKERVGKAVKSMQKKPNLEEAVERGDIRSIVIAMGRAQFPEYMKGEFQDVRKKLFGVFSKSGIPFDMMAADIASAYPQLGIKSDQDLKDALIEQISGKSRKIDDLKNKTDEEITDFYNKFMEKEADRDKRKQQEILDELAEASEEEIIETLSGEDALDEINENDAYKQFSDAVDEISNKQGESNDVDIEKLQKIKDELKDTETEDLENYIEDRYEEGAEQEELDFLEEIYAERIANEEGLLDDLEEEPDGEASLEAGLIGMYKRFIDGSAETSGMSKEDVIGNMRGNLENFAKKPLPDVTDEQILEAAKELYEARVELMKRKEGRKDGEPLVKAEDFIKKIKEGSDEESKKVQQPKEKTVKTDEEIRAEEAEAIQKVKKSNKDFLINPKDSQVSNLGQVIVDLVNQEEADINSPDFHVKITSDGFMDLHIQKVYDTGLPQIAIAHTTVQNGDVMLDPEVVFDIVNGQLQARTIEQSFLGGGQKKINPNDPFLRLWADNIREQGFVKDYKKTPDWEKTQRDYQSEQAVKKTGSDYVLDHRDKKRHENIVKTALEDGEPVPSYVLEDYPWLKKKPEINEDDPFAREALKTKDQYIKSMGSPRITQAAKRLSSTNIDDFPTLKEEAESIINETLDGHKSFIQTAIRENLVPIDKLRELHQKDYPELFSERAQEVRSAPEKTFEEIAYDDGSLESLIFGFAMELKAGELPSNPKELRKVAWRILGDRYEQMMALSKEKTYDLIYDAMEGAFNKFAVIRTDRSLADQLNMAEELENQIPLRARSTQIIENQQFSTPFTLAAAANYVLDPMDWDIIIEPTAGTGNLVFPFVMPQTARYILNEADERRANVLKALGNEDHTITKGDFLRFKDKGTSVIANPPFGALGKGKYAGFEGDGFKGTNLDQRFIQKMLKMLPEGGRIAVIVSEGTGVGESGYSFRSYLQKEHTLIASIASPEGAYKHRGSPKIGTVLMVIEKGKRRGRVESLIKKEVKDWTEYASYMTMIRGKFPRLTVQQEDLEQIKKQEVGHGTVKTSRDSAKRDSGGSERPVRSKRPGVQRDTDKSDDGDADVRSGSEGIPRKVPSDAGQRIADGGITRDERKREAGKRIGSFVEYKRNHTRSVTSPHPSTIVESEELSTVRPPAIRYEPSKILNSAHTNGNLSDEQLDAVLLAIQAIDNKKGFLIGDDVGVGKTREMAGIIAEMLESGRANRLLYVTKSKQILAGHLEGDFAAVMSGKQKAKLPFRVVNLSAITNLSKKEVPLYNKSIYTTTWNQLSDHIDAFLKMGLDAFVIDEAHLWKINNNPKARKVISWDKLHLTYQDKPFVYATATAGTTLSEMEYLYGLNEWKKDGFHNYIAAVTGKEPKKKGFMKTGSVYSSSTSIPLTQQVMREFKMKGLFLSRDLARENVEFEALQMPMLPEDIQAFDEYSEFLKNVYKIAIRYGRYNKAKNTTGIVASSVQNAAKRKLVDIKVQKAIPYIKKDIEEGKRVILFTSGLNDVGERGGYLYAAINAINQDQVEKVQGEVYTEEIPEAIEKKAELLDEMDGFPDQLSVEDFVDEQFGNEYSIAKYTGNVTETGKRKAIKDWAEGRIDIMVGSDAAKTAISLHDTIGKQIAVYYLDIDFNVTNFKQSLGRANRSGEVTSPIIRLAHLGSGGEQKFISTVATRMKSLGATSKGQAESGVTDFLGEFDLEGDVAHEAARKVYDSLPIEDREYFINNKLWERSPDGEPRPRYSAPKDYYVDSFLRDLNYMPYNKGRQMFQALIDMYKSELDAASEVVQFKSEKSTGKELRTIDLYQSKEDINNYVQMHEVVDKTDTRFAVVTGMLTDKMKTLKEHGVDKYIKFITDDNRILSGLKVLPSRISALAKQFGKNVASSITKDNVFDVIMGGDKAPVVGGYEIYKRRDNSIGIKGAKMKDKQTLQKAGAKYNPTGNAWFLEPTPEAVGNFLEYYPLDNKGASEDPQPMMNPVKKLKDEGGFIRIGGRDSKKKVKVERLEDLIEELHEQQTLEEYQNHLDKLDGELNAAFLTAKVDEMGRLEKFSENTRKLATFYIQYKNNPDLIDKYYEQMPDDVKGLINQLDNMTDEDIAYAEEIEQRLEELRIFGQSTGVLESALDDYITQIWKKQSKKKKTKAEFQSFAQKFKHSYKRVFTEGYMQGIALGYEPLTLDSTKLLRIYEERIATAVHTKIFMDTLKQMILPNGKKALEFARTALGDDDYTTITHPALTKYKFVGKKIDPKTNEVVPNIVKMPLMVHKDVAPRITALLKNSTLRDMKGIKQALALSALAKSAKLSFSGFHYMALAKSAIFYGVNPLPYGKNNYAVGIDLIREKDPIVMHGVKVGGLTFTSSSKVQYSTVVANQSFDYADQLLDKIGMGALKGVNAKLRKGKEIFDAGLWDYYYQGLKAISYRMEFLRNLKRYPDLSRDELAVISAKSINNNFGGVNFRRMQVDESHVDMLRFVLLAPDWTVSNWSMFFNSVKGRDIFDYVTKRKLVPEFDEEGNITKVTPIKEFKNTTKGESRYMAKVVFTLLGLVMLMNYALHRKPFPEDKRRWYMIELLIGSEVGKPYHLDLLGHFFEPIKAFAHPDRWWSGKKSMALNLAFNIFGSRDWKGDWISGFMDLTEGKLARSKYLDKPNYYSTIPSRIIKAGLLYVPIPAVSAYETFVSKERLPQEFAGDLTGLHVRRGRSFPEIKDENSRKKVARKFYKARERAEHIEDKEKRKAAIKDLKRRAKELRKKLKK